MVDVNTLNDIEKPNSTHVYGKVQVKPNSFKKLVSF